MDVLVILKIGRDRKEGARIPHFLAAVHDEVDQGVDAGFLNVWAVL